MSSGPARRSLCSAAALALLAVGLRAEAAAAGVRLTLPPGAPREVLPGQIVTLAVLARNTGSRTLRLRESLALPPDWTPLDGGRAFRLRPGASDVRLLAARAPQAALAPAGSYRLTYRVWRVGRSSAAAEVELPVEIKPVVRLEVSLQSAPSFVPAGTGYQALFLVANRGNVAQTARVELQSGDSFPAQPDVERFSLPPGQSRVVTVLVRTDPKLPRALLHRLRLRLLAAGSVAQAYCQVRVVPIVSQTEDPYRRLQSRAGVEGGGEQGRSALQFNWSGGGFLDAAGGRWLDFRLQQPMDQSLTLFGFRQELAASYRWKGGESQVGDAGYTLSPLTQLYEFGRGARAQAALGPLRVGGFAMETRGRPTVEHRQAAFVAFNPGGKPLRLRANWLKKGPGGGDEIGSVQAELGPAAGLGLNLEYAAGRSPLRKAPPSQQAWNARLEGRAWGRYPMLAEKIHAGRDFNGYYSDADLTRLQLGAPLGARLGVDLSFYKDVFNLDADPARSAAPWQQRATASLRWARTPRMSWDLSFEDERSKDRLPGSSMDLGARQASLGLTRLFGSLSARLTGSMNWIDDLAAAHAYDYGGAGINLSYLARRAQSYSAFAELGPQGLAVDSPRELVVGAGADVTPLSGLVVDAQLERRDPGAAGPASLRYLASIHWRFFGSESLSLRAQLLDYPGSSRPGVSSIFGGYSHDFAIPIARRADLGAVAGTVVESGGRPLDGVLVDIDGTLALSDRRGRFTFRSLEPGKHFLWVESLGRGLVLERKVPAVIEVAGGRTLRLELRAVRQAALELQVELYDAAGRPLVVSSPGQLLHLVPAGPAAGLDVELSREDETISQATDADGRLSLRGLRPGRWRIRLDSSGLARRYRLERESFEVELKPGESSVISVRAVPRLRKVIFLRPERH